MVSVNRSVKAIALKSSSFSLWKPSNRPLFAYLLLVPALVITLVVIVYPVAYALDLSFQDVQIAQVGMERLPWTLENYVELFESQQFWSSVFVTALFVAVVTTGAFVVGLATALLVNRRFRARAAARMLIALPWAVPGVIAAVIWWWLFDSSFGLINWVLVRLGVVDVPISWFGRPETALLALWVIMIWKGYPFMSVMLLAGLQAIPEELYESAAIDGANAWNRFRYITLPGLRPVTAIALVINVLWVFRNFETIWVITAGGPIGSTRTLAILTYEEGFGFYHMGYASAIGIVTLIISLLASIVLIRRLSSSIY